MKTMKRGIMIAAALMLAAGAAQAGSLSLTGTVEAGVTIPVYAPIGGTVDTVSVESGMRVAAGDPLFSYRTEKVYAAEDGTVTGVFAQPGDDAEKTAEKYGADLYIEGSVLYTVSSSVSKAYSSVETTFMHTGETVYLICRTDANRKGQGIITSVDGSSYKVLVTEGSFVIGDSVTVFRDSEGTEKQRIGRGNVERVSPTAVSTTGAVVSVAVKDGDTVKRGDLLMETLSGTFEGYQMTGTAVTAEEEGVIMSVSAEAGAAVNKGDVAARIAPVSGMRVEAAVSADDRMNLKAGDKVRIELEADENKSYEGTVRYISEVPEEGTEEVTYKAIIDFTPDEDICFGMNVAVITAEEAEEEPAEETEQEEPAAEEQAGAEEAAPAEAEEQKTGRPSRSGERPGRPGEKPTAAEEKTSEQE